MNRLNEHNCTRSGDEKPAAGEPGGGLHQGPARLTRIIRERDVDQFCGLKRTQRAALIARGEFPRPIALSTRAKGYLESELIAWQQARRAKRDEPPAASHRR